MERKKKNFPHISFGKFAGVPLRSVPSWYLEWILSQDWFRKKFLLQADDVYHEVVARNETAKKFKQAGKLKQIDRESEEESDEDYLRNFKQIDRELDDDLDDDSNHLARDDRAVA